MTPTEIAALKDLLATAEQQMAVFDRCSRQVGLDLIAAIRSLLADNEAMRGALEEIDALPAEGLHVGYDSGAGGGNYVYRDAMFADDVRAITRRALGKEGSGK